MFKPNAQRKRVWSDALQVCFGRDGSIEGGGVWHCTAVLMYVCACFFLLSFACGLTVIPNEIPKPNHDHDTHRRWCPSI